jgi:segregation and condensation protein A
MKELEEKRSEVYTKIPENLKDFADIKKLPKGIFDLDDLYEAYMAYLKRKKMEKPLNTRISHKEMSIDDRIKHIRTILDEKKKVEFFDLFTTFNKENIVITFLSILEMAKKDEIYISQIDNFSPIYIEKRA